MTRRNFIKIVKKLATYAEAHHIQADPNTQDILFWWNAHPWHINAQGYLVPRLNGQDIMQEAGFWAGLESIADEEWWTKWMNKWTLIVKEQLDPDTEQLWQQQFQKMKAAEENPGFKELGFFESQLITKFRDFK